jgi:hypothetical protein
VRDQKTTANFNQFTITDKYFFCLRPDEGTATIVSNYISRVNANETFRRTGYKYFLDYPEMAAKIKNKTYKYNDIEEVVNVYNTWKGEKH